MKLERTGSKWDRKNRNAINENWDRLEVVMKSIDELVIKGSLTPYQHAQLISELNGLVKKGNLSVHDIDKNKGLLDQSFMSEEFLKQIAGTAPVLSTLADNAVTSNKIAPRAVRLEHLAFTAGVSENLFKGDYREGWLAGYREPLDMAMRANFSDADGIYDGRTAVIPVLENQDIHIRIEDVHDVFRVGFHDKEPDFTATSNSSANALFHSVSRSVAGSNFITHSPTGAKYLLVTTSSEGREPELYVNYGTEYTGGQRSPRIPSQYIDRTESVNNLAFTTGRVSSNLGGVVEFREEDSFTVLNESIYLSEGFVVGLHDYKNHNINVIGWDKDTGEYLGGYGRRSYETVIDQTAIYQISVRKEDGTLFSPHDLKGINKLLYVERGGTQALRSYKFAIGAVQPSTGEELYRDSGSYAILTKRIELPVGTIVGLKDYSEYSLNVTRWNKATGEYLGDYGRGTSSIAITEDNVELQISPARLDDNEMTADDLLKLNDLLTIVEPGEERAETIRHHVFADSIDYDFEPFNVYNYEQDGLPRTVTSSFMNAQYDDLVASDTAYITKRQEAESVQGKPIYSYTFKPHTLDSRGVDVRYPKVILLAGVHGNEKTPVFATHALLNLITNHWRENKLLEFLRFNIQFEVIGIVNPDGFDANARRNHNDIDLNREMPSSWSSGSTNGVTPLTQPESNAVYDFINQHSDAAYGIDFHNMLFRDGYTTFATTTFPFVNRMMNRVLISMNRDWQKKYPFHPQDPNHQFGFTATPVGGSVNSYFNSIGIPGVTLEIFRQNRWESPLPPEYGDTLNHMAVELLARTLKTFIKQLQ